MEKIRIVILILFLLCGLSFGIEGAKNTTKLIKPKDLIYKGAFRLPDGPPVSEVKTWAWGGSAATYYPSGDPNGIKDGYPGSIFGVGHAWAHQVSEISIPKPVRSKNLNDLPVAKNLAGFPRHTGCQQPGNPQDRPLLSSQAGKPENG